MSQPTSPFDWREAAELALTSRAIDDLEESQLYPSGDVLYQFSARGHELGQVLLSQLLPSSTHPLRSQLKQLVYQALVD